MSEVAVRGMRGEDLPEILEMERATAQAPHWGEDVYRALLETREREDDAGAVGGGIEARSGMERRLLVATGDKGEGGAVLAGFAVGSIVWAQAPGVAGQRMLGAVGELESVVVRRELRRSGVGRALCTALLAWMRHEGAARVELEVRASNAGAIALYRGMGFTEQGWRRRYYDGPTEDALLMVRGEGVAEACVPGGLPGPT